MIPTVLTSSVDRAARFIRAGRVVAFPTETVYGLGADATNESAVQEIFEAKRRPVDNPLIVHIADMTDVEKAVTSVPDHARRLMDLFFPGPLTLVLPRNPHIPEIVSAGLPTIGIRMPDHPTALAFIRACRVPVAAPSANVSGRPSPTTWESVQEDLDGRIACILKDDPTHVGLESTVVDCTGEHPIVLRTGGVTIDQMREVVPGTVMSGSGDSALRRSPGTRHRHYSPVARVVIVDGLSEIPLASGTAFIGFSADPDPNRFIKAFNASDLGAYARRLFEFFRECDRAGVETIYCQRVPRKGIGAALMDRIERAVAG